MKLVRKIIKGYKDRFEDAEIDLDNGNYMDLLSYEAGRIFYVVFLGLFAMLFYIPQDMKIHDYPQMALVLRIGMCVISAVAIILKSTKFGKSKPRELIMIIMIYHCVMIAILAGTAGSFAAPYITGFAFVMMIFIIAPFSMLFKTIIYAGTIILFFTLGIITGLDFDKDDVRYSLNDMTAAVGLCLLFSYTVNEMRLNSWKQRQELNRMLEQNKRDIETISKLAEESKAASRAKSTFLANMSHEIRTPINAVMGMIELALREENLAVAKEQIFMAKHAASNLLAIINDVLDFSKIEAGKLEVVMRKYAAPSLITDVVSIIRARVADLETNISFAVKVDCNIPYTMYGDETRLRQIALNILNNAVKYTENGHVLFSVYAKNVKDNMLDLIFEVTDTGIGIKDQDIPELFNDFSQFDIENKKINEGVGLGLAITHNIVKAMGGTIEVSSTYGKGSQFIITIPQEFDTEIKLASVKKSNNRYVLVFAEEGVLKDSLVWSLGNLDVGYIYINCIDELHEKINIGAYNFLFITYDLYKKHKKLIRKLGDSIRIAAITGFGEVVSDKNIGIISAPVYCTAIADILNGVQGEFSYSDSAELIAGFKAPDVRVLVVDDILTNLKVTEGLLAPYDMQVDLCNNGADAVEAVKNAAKPYDIIFMDHKMPVMDGVEATEKIRKLSKTRMPIIALTAHVEAGSKEIYVARGFDDYIPKPIDAKGLNSILEKWIPAGKKRKV